ncbi:MAG: hypothetical protein J5733_12185 [Bacteroidaceae bacterium]|nr:hypothetical protein [Bacteroidaceae bacterium]
MNETFNDDAVKGQLVIDGSKVETFKKEIVSCNILTVEVGTTGHMGGDSGHGGRTYLRIADEASTDMRCRVIANGKLHEFDNTCQTNQIEIVLGGDCELDTFAEALRFAADVLKRDAMPIYEPSRKEVQQQNFCLYIDELCELYRKSGKLSGMGEVQKKYHVAAVTKQQFFECELHKAGGYIHQDFCNEVYEYILDRTKAIPAPKYEAE